MEKMVQIWDLQGNLLIGGIMDRQTFLGLVKDHSNSKSVEYAEILWDQATPFSLSDYLETIKVRVQEIYGH
jgi:hypothetical protein